MRSQGSAKFAGFTVLQATAIHFMRSTQFEKYSGFNSSRVAGRSIHLQRPDYPLGHTVQTSSKTRSQLRILAKKIGKIGFML